MHVLVVSVLGGALLSFGVVSGFAADKTIEATNSTAAWMPSTATVSPGGTVEFKNTSTSVSHGVMWNAANPAVPSCPGVASTGMPNWSGTCTFTQSGTYNFVCSVHANMTGTVTVSGPAAPTVTPESATAITDTGATLKASVNPNGQATTYFFEYGTTTGYGLETPEESAGAGTSSVSKSKPVTGLTPETTYHFRMVAKNDIGTTDGADRTFRTGAAPTATTDAASGIGPVAATLKGTVNPKGLETKYFFNYGTTAAYGQKTSETVAGSGTSNVTASKSVTGLAPETEYHFQVVAKNSAGEVKGTDRTFTTTGGPVASTGQATGVGETGATVEGVVNPQGQQTSYFFNYGTTSTYGQKTSEKAAGSGASDINVSEQLTGLSPGTTYHFQVVAKNAGGTTPGADKTFTTSSMSSPPPPPPPPPPPAPTPSPTLESTPPDTKITLKPAAKTRDRTPTIKFRATVGGAGYQCSVDSKPFKTCRSPFTAPSLKPGKHRIRVKAVVGGVADPTPASCNFKVMAAR
jgi:plastocyanin